MALSKLYFTRSFKFNIESSSIYGVSGIASKHFFYPVNGNLRVVTDRAKIALLFYNKALFKSYLNKIRKGLLGLQYGFYSELITIGVGYRFEKQQKDSNVLTMNLGYSHFIHYKLSELINFRTLKSYLFLFSNNPDFLTKVAYRIKRFRFPDSYKGKGIRYFKEIIPLKPGKIRQK